MPEVRFDPAAVPPKDRYKILTGTVIPRPIAVVSTLSADGRPNLAPFSFFTVAAYDPMVLAFFPLKYKRDKELKDTVRNLAETGECVVHICTEELAEAANRASGKYDHGVDEFALAGLETVASERVRPFRIKGAKAAFECRLWKTLEIGAGEGGSDAMFVEVVLAHLDADLLDGTRVDAKRLAPVARLAGSSWVRLGEVFELERPG